MFKFALHSPPGPLNIYSINARINQSYFLTSLEDPKITARPPPVKRLIFALDAHSASPNTSPLATPDSPRNLTHTLTYPPPPKHMPPTPPQSPDCSKKSSPLLATVDAGQYYEITHLARLPDDDLIRPTTQPGTQSAVQIGHCIVFEVKFSQPDVDLNGGSKTLSSTHPITLSSCCCMLESLVLPRYSQTDPCPARRPERRNSSMSCRTCICGASIEGLMAQHEGILVRTTSSDYVPPKPAP
jgi:hypothetical protein